MVIGAFYVDERVFRHGQSSPDKLLARYDAIKSVAGIVASKRSDLGPSIGNTWFLIASFVRGPEALLALRDFAWRDRGPG